MAATVEVVVKDPTAQPGLSPFSTVVPRSSTVNDLKGRLETEWPGSPSPASQRLVHAGKLLTGGEVVGKLADAGGPVFHVILSPTPSTTAHSSTTSRAPPAEPQMPASSSANSGPSANPQVPDQQPQPEPPAQNAYPMPMDPNNPVNIPGDPYGAQNFEQYGQYAPPPYAADGTWAPHGMQYWYPPQQGYYGFPPHHPPAPPQQEDYGLEYFDPNYPQGHGMMPPQMVPQYQGDPRQLHYPPMPAGNDGRGGQEDQGQADPGVPVNGGAAMAAGGMRRQGNHQIALRAVLPNHAHQHGPQVDFQGVRVREFNFHIQVNWVLLLKLGFIVFLLHVEGDNVRLFGLIVGAVLVYLWQTGKLDFVRNYARMMAPNAEAIAPWARQDRNGEAGDPGENDRGAEPSTERLQAPVGVAMNVYSFVYGLVCSIWPSWKPEDAVRPRRRPRRDRAGGGAANGAGADAGAGAGADRPAVNRD